MVHEYEECSREFRFKEGEMDMTRKWLIGSLLALVTLWVVPAGASPADVVEMADDDDIEVDVKPGMTLGVVGRF